VSLRIGKRYNDSANSFYILQSMRQARADNEPGQQDARMEE